MILSAWKVRGAAQPIRFLLEYIGTPYIDRMYDLSEVKQSKATTVKDALGVGGTFPHLHDDPEKLSGLIKIMTYITTTYMPDLLGRTPEMIEKVTDVQKKLKFAFDRLVMRSYSKATFEEVEALSTMQPIVNLLGNNTFVAGGDITYMDFLMLELCEYGDYLSQNKLYSQHPNVDRYVKAMKELKQIKEYVESGRLKGLNFNNKTAKIS